MAQEKRSKLPALFEKLFQRKKKTKAKPQKTPADRSKKDCPCNKKPSTKKKG